MSVSSSSIGQEDESEVSGVVLGRIKIVVFSVYRPPSGDSYLFLEIINRVLCLTDRYKSLNRILRMDLNLDVTLDSSKLRNFLNLHYGTRIVLHKL